MAKRKPKPFAAFMDKVLQPGVLDDGQYGLDVRKLGTMPQTLVRQIDAAVNEAEAEWPLINVDPKDWAALPYRVRHNLSAIIGSYVRTSKEAH